MSQTVRIETAARDLEGLLARLKLGETVTLVGSQGLPEALLVSLKPEQTDSPSAPDWEARWEALAQRISEAWQSDKSAIETLTEMR